MEKLNAFFKKIDKDLLVGALCLVAAILLFVNPGAVLHTIIKIVGALILAGAVLRFIFAVNNGRLVLFAALNAALLFALGLIMLVTPGGTLRFIFSAIGVYLLVNALLQVFKLVVVPKPARGIFWWTDVVFTVIVFILGVWLLLSPSDAGRLTEIIAAVSLTVKGVELLCRAFDTHRKKGKGFSKKQAGSSDIEVDYIDKSHEL